MKPLKTKSLTMIEERLQDIDPETMRARVLESARAFKTSWLDLGQILYTVWTDKLFKDWGYSSFEGYTRKEIGIKKQTALKLLKSYEFLEKEEPAYLRAQYTGKGDASRLPALEAIDMLRRAARRKDLDREDIASLKKNVLEEGREVGEARKDLTALIRQREELAPDEARQKKRIALLRRFLSSLKAVIEEARVLKMLPAKTIKDADKLIADITKEIPH
ncbi:MAG: hypothetical protein JW844_03960 [Candidatus Omnitrophica bacterium]|nr:hypothetical protein [Candidatus Omnitrophota bacterium]